jgi:uncharacterized RDD family membrane protein YckC
MIRRLRWLVLSTALLLGLATGAPLAAQVSTTKPASPAPASPVQSWRTLRDRIDDDPRSRVWGRPVLRVGIGYDLPADDSVRDTAVIFGDATIDGFVDGDLTVVLGDLRLGSTAVVKGALNVIGGNVTVAPGALVRDQLVLVGGQVSAPSDVFVGGGHVVIGAPAFGDRLRAVVPWLTHGLLLGRLIVPSLGWVWWFAGVAFLISLLVNLAFHEPVSASAAILSTRPLGSFLAGLLVMLLVAPLTLLLLASLVGVLVLPFVLCAIVVAGVIGKAGVARALGASLVPPEDPEPRVLALRSFVIGSIVIDILYMVPVLGLATWALSGVLGLGSAVLAFFAALRKENPVVRREADVPPVPPAPSPVRAAAPSLAAEPILAVPSEPVVPPPAAPAMAALAGAGSAAAIGVDLRAFPHATFGDRLAAFALDLLLLLIVTIWIDQGRDSGNRFLLYALAYFIIFWAWKGTTVGGIICNLRVVRVDGARLGPGDAVVRGLSGILSIAAAGLGGLWILRDPDQQAWHDRIAGTFVVKVPREWPVG